MGSQDNLISKEFLSQIESTSQFKRGSTNQEYIGECLN